MPENGKTAYQTCREAAGITRDRAAELLNVSSRQLARYESGEAFPPDDVVSRMMDLYGSTFLGVQHVRASGEVGRRIVPAVSQVSLERAAIQIHNALARFQERNAAGQLLSMAEDGVIDEAERPLFKEIVGILEELMGDYLELRIAGGLSSGEGS